MYIVGDKQYYWDSDEGACVETTDTWDSKVYIPGKFDVEINGLDTETPKAKIKVVDLTLI